MIEVSEIINVPVHASFAFHKTGIEPIGAPTFEEWVSCGQIIGNADRGVHFWIGDWLNFGEMGEWGKMYEEAIEQTGFDYQTLKKDKWVASRVQLVRRRTNLSFGHHEVVAPYDEDEQEILLDAAETLGLSVRQLREQKERILHPPKIIELGQTWQLGAHTLYCGDSASKHFQALALQSEASFAFADPPYNAGVDEWDKDFVWDHDYLIDAAPIVGVTPGISEIKNFMRSTRMPYKWSMSYWIDNGMTRGALGFGNWMYVALFSEGSIFRNAQDLARIQDQDMERISITGGDQDTLKHKGRKPIEMMEHIVDLFTKQGDIVIDPFLGTGTTLIACEKLERVCIGAEISPEYCESIIRRWEKLTGKEAVLWQTS